MLGARALTQKADVLLLDEAFAGLNATSEHSLIELLISLTEKVRQLFWLLMTCILCQTLAITITGSIQTVGIILVIAMLITPGSTAFLLTKHFPTMLQIAVTVSVISSLAGAHASYYFDVATGGTLVSGRLLSGTFRV